MSEEQVLAALKTALKLLEEQWANRAKEATQYAEQNRGRNLERAQYYRGVADGLKIAIKDLQDALNPPSSKPDNAETAPMELYAAVGVERARAVLEQIGLGTAELHAHKDHTFTASFNALQALTLEARIAQLEAAGATVLDTGRLPNSTKTYIDFGFQQA